VKNVALLTAIGFILFMSIGVTAPINSLYAESLGASYVAIGLLEAVTSLSMILSGYVWGRASDRLGQRKVFLVVGLGTLAVGQGLKAAAPSYEYLFPLNILGAIAQAAYVTISLALMGDLLEQRPDEQGRRMGLYRGLGSLGFSLMAFLSGGVADRFSIRVPFVLASLVLVVASWLASSIQEPSPDPTAQVTLRDWIACFRLVLDSAREAAGAMADQFGGLIRRHPNGEGLVKPGPTSTTDHKGAERLPLNPLLISTFLWSLAFGAVVTVWPNYMVGELGYTQGDVGRLWSFAAFFEFPLMILTGWLSDRIGRLPMLGLGLLAWVVVFGGYVLVPVMPWIIVIQLVRGFAYAAFTATAMTYAAEARPKSERGWASGLYNSSSGIGNVLGSFTGGALAQFTGFRTMISINAMLILVGAIYVTVVAVRRAARIRKGISC
jgi:MFS family permease